MTLLNLSRFYSEFEFFYQECIINDKLGLNKTASKNFGKKYTGKGRKSKAEHLSDEEFKKLAEKRKITFKVSKNSIKSEDKYEKNMTS